MHPGITIHIGEIHVHYGDNAVLVEAVNNLEETFMAVSARLQAAIDNTNARLEQTNTELDAIATALDNQDAVTAAAVATALAAAGVDEDKAADLITTATNSVREHIDAVFAKVGVTPPNTSGGDDTSGGTGGNDTISGGGGDDTVTTGAATFDLVTTALPDAVTGEAYTGSLEFTGGTAPYSVTNAPIENNGVTLNTDGSATGTATADGDFTFGVAAQDSSDPVQTVTKSVSLHSATPAPVEQQ